MASSLEAGGSELPSWMVTISRSPSPALNCFLQEGVQWRMRPELQLVEDVEFWTAASHIQMHTPLPDRVCFFLLVTVESRYLKIELGLATKSDHSENVCFSGFIAVVYIKEHFPKQNVLLP